jgi:hypothetical protein
LEKAARPSAGDALNINDHRDAIAVGILLAFGLEDRESQRKLSASPPCNAVAHVGLGDIDKHPR